MASQDLYSYIAPVSVFANTNATANATAQSAAIDLAQFESATFIFNNQTCSGTTTLNYEILESNATASGGFTAVADTYLIGSEADLELTSSTTNQVKKIGYIGDKRYVAVKYTATSVQTGAVFNALCVRGNPVELQD